MSGISTSSVAIQHETKSMGGNFHYHGYEIDVPAVTGSHHIDVSFPFNVNVFRGSFVDRPGYEQDQIIMSVSPGTIIGATTSAHVLGESVLTVSPTVIENLNVGHTVHIISNGTPLDLGRCLNIDYDLSEITTETALSEDADPGSYITMTVFMVPELYLSGTNAVVKIEGTTRTSFLPKNTPIKVEYINNSGTAKKFHFTLEYLF